MDAGSGRAGHFWSLGHTRPRCEKKFAALLLAEGISHYLPLLELQRRYDGRLKRSSRPLFPGYVFLHASPQQRVRVFQQDLLARLIPVEDETLLLRQLAEVRRILASGFAVAVQPLFVAGSRVRVIDGPLAGLEGGVQDPSQPGKIVIAVDVLRQGLQLTLPIEHLHVLP